MLLSGDKKNMQKNETAIIKIEDIGVDGEGIGKVGGYTLFVKDAVIGDEVEVKVMKAKKNYGYARLMRIINPSQYRVEPKCPYARSCGGCQIQEMSYEKQLEFKEKKVRGNLERIGGFDAELLECIMEPIVGMENPFHYRNKAQFPFGTDKNGEPVCGFYAGRTHDIIANTDCALGVDVNKTILELILKFMKEYQIPAYDEKTGRGLIRHALIRYGFITKEIMVCLVINGHRIPHSAELVRLLSKLDGMTSISFSPNTKQTNVIMGDSYEVLWGQGYITDFIGGIQYQISPLSFYQVNHDMAEKLYQKAAEFADLKGTETVLDLYCGTGTIGLSMAKKARKIYGAEIVPQAIENAKENARLNNIENAEFFCGDAADAAKRFRDMGIKPDVVLLDPPRKGCDEAVLSTVAEMNPEKIVYVSCDCATLARDAQRLSALGYAPNRLAAADLFPRTAHVESVVLLSRAEK